MKRFHIIISVELMSMDHVILCFLFSILFFVATAHDNSFEDCPRGSYRPNAKVKDCKLCAKGYYGETHGLTSKYCTAACPIGKYGGSFGAMTDEDCTFVRNPTFILKL